MQKPVEALSNPEAPKDASWFKEFVTFGQLQIGLGTSKIMFRSTLRVPFEARSYRTIGDLVRQGLGVALMPRSLAGDHAVSVAPSMHRTVWLIRRKGRQTRAALDSSVSSHRYAVLWPTNFRQPNRPGQACAGLTMAQPRTVFLMYHELELPDRPLCQSEAGYVRYILFAHDFLAQMERLKLANWRGVSVTSAPRGPFLCSVSFPGSCGPSFWS